MQYKANGIFEPWEKSPGDTESDFGIEQRCMVIGRNFCISPHPRKKTMFKVSHIDSGIGMALNEALAESGFDFETSVIWGKLLQENYGECPVRLLEAPYSQDDTNLFFEWMMCLSGALIERLEQVESITS